jgi:hypothetical protein
LRYRGGLQFAFAAGSVRFVNPAFAIIPLDDARNALYLRKIAMRALSSVG